uniref:Probable protein-export membrane protein SecG n=1 Tax=Sciadococcus taiwanensis TaxID=3028030 RepID=A0A9Y1I2B4_9RHOD|nr:preprotein translocase SecG subunit [Sciadococcus taiwanensis]
MNMTYTLLQVIMLISVICLIISIMIYNPKYTGIGLLNTQTQFLNNTRSSSEIINRVIWILTSIIFICTITLSYQEHLH